MLLNVLNYLSVFIVFSGAVIFGNTNSFEVRGSYFIMALVFIFWIPLIKRSIVFNRVFFIPFAAVILFSLLNAARSFTAPHLLAKQAIGISVNALWFYTLIKINRYDIKRLFKIYLDLAFVVSLIGIVQEISFILNFTPGYNYQGFLPYWYLLPKTAHNLLRVNSIMIEPSGLAVVLLPAVFACVTALLKQDYGLVSKVRGIVIVSCFLLTFSSTGYIGLLLAVFFAMFRSRNLKRVLISSGVILLLFFGLYNVSNEFKIRVDDSIDALCGKKDLRDTNFSTFVLYNSAKVAYSSFRSSPVIGTGLGSFELFYEKIFPDLNKDSYFEKFTVIKDGASLFLRLISETGLLGIMFLLIFLIRFFVSFKKGPSWPLWIINNAALLFILIRLIRVGHYFSDGFFLFFWMYYFSRKQAEGAANEET